MKALLLSCLFLIGCSDTPKAGDCYRPSYEDWFVEIKSINEGKESTVVEYEVHDESSYFRRSVDDFNLVYTVNIDCSIFEYKKNEYSIKRLNNKMIDLEYDIKILKEKVNK